MSKELSRKELDSLLVCKGGSVKRKIAIGIMTVYGLAAFGLVGWIVLSNLGVFTIMFGVIATIVLVMAVFSWAEDTLF